MAIRKKVLRGAFFFVKLKAQNSIVAFFSYMKLDMEGCFYLV